MKSETLGELAKAMCRVQSVIEPAVKSSANPFFKSHYADLVAVWNSIRQPLTENGLAITHLVGSISDGKISMETMILHTSGEYISFQSEMPFLKNDPQAVGSAITYLRRYIDQAVTSSVSEGEDDDGNKASAKETVKEEPPKREAPKKEVRQGVKQDLIDALSAYCTTEDGLIDTSMANGILAEIAKTKKGYLEWDRLQTIDEDKWGKWIEDIYTKWNERNKE